MRSLLCAAYNRYSPAARHRLSHGLPPAILVVGPIIARNITTTNCVRMGHCHRQGDLTQRVSGPHYPIKEKQTWPLRESLSSSHWKSTITTPSWRRLSTVRKVERR